MTNDGESKPPEADDEGPKLPDESNRVDSDKLPDFDALFDKDRLFETLFHGDRITAEISVFCLKAVLVLNGAAAIALISMHGIIAGTGGIGSALAGAGYFFLSGLVTAGIAAGFAYYDRRTEGTMIVDQLVKIHQGKTPRPRPRFVFFVFDRLMSLLCIVSFGLFVYGGASILKALEKLAGNG